MLGQPPPARLADVPIRSRLDGVSVQDPAEFSVELNAIMRMLKTSVASALLAMQEAPVGKNKRSKVGRGRGLKCHAVLS